MLDSRRHSALASSLDPRYRVISMDKSAEAADPRNVNSVSPSSNLVREFVEHWGMMARAWGINPTMGELFALLYITGTDWTAEELRHWLHVSRGNVSMNLRELLAWGVVRKLHRPGERRELFHAETDVWTLFRRILKERKRRELDPTLMVLDRISRLSEAEPDFRDLKTRVESLRHFFGLIDGLAVRLLSLETQELSDLGMLLGDDPAASGAIDLETMES
jgi:HTH-type transcriptional regulator, glycine betaine synthesis regulator